MKKVLLALTALSLSLCLLAGCGQSTSTETASSSEPSSAASSSDSAATESSPEAASSTEAAPSSDTADEAALEAAVTALEAASPISNPRAYDDFSVENEMGLTMDNIVAYKGDVTNDQSDCALVFVAQVKDGMADTVKAELEAYQATMTSSLYAEFADKVAQAEDARIGSVGNFVYMVIAGVNGGDYAAIDTALGSAFAS